MFLHCYFSPRIEIIIILDLGVKIITRDEKDWIMQKLSGNGR